MPVVNNFMGRVFLVPQNETPQGKTVLYMNFGFNSVGNQLFPLYQDKLLGQYFSEAQYNRVSSRITEYLSQNGTSASCGMAAIFVAAMTMGIVSCPLCYVYCKVKEIDNQLQKTIQEECAQWKCDVKLVWEDICQPVANCAATISYDETGRVLESEFPAGDVGYYTAPAWPPLGYSIILTIQGTELRTRWQRAKSSPPIHAIAAEKLPGQQAMAVDQPSLVSQLEQLADLLEVEVVSGKGRPLG